jgi:glycosyltransferase involved in cell wall biosynthesis
MSSGDNLPRVLIVSNVCPESDRAGSIVMDRLFRGYPAERVLVAGPAPRPGALLPPFRRIVAESPLSERLLNSRLRPAVASLVELGLWKPLGFEVPADFEPEAVVSVMESPRYYRLADRIARKRNLPLALVLHDVPESFNRAWPLARRRQLAANSAIYRRAARRFCVSPEMEASFRLAYGAEGEALYPIRSDSLRPRPPEESRTLKDGEILTLGYAGGLGYGYDIQIARLSEALAGKPFRINVYAEPGSGSVAPNPEVVRWRGRSPSPEEAWSRFQAECDAALLPYCWEEAIFHLYFVHFPSKLAEYMALGMPVVAMGPGQATGVAWAARHPEAAVAISQNDPAAWADALERLRTDPGRRASLAANALEAGNGDFEPEAIRRQFWDGLRAMMGQGASRP